MFIVRQNSDMTFLVSSHIHLFINNNNTFLVVRFGAHILIEDRALAAPRLQVLVGILLLVFVVVDMNWMSRSLTRNNNANLT